MPSWQEEVSVIRAGSLLVAAAVLALVAGCATTLRDWIIAKQENTPAAYREFLTSHPNSEYSLAAEERALLTEVIWHGVGARFVADEKAVLEAKYVYFVAGRIGNQHMYSYGDCDFDCGLRPVSVTLTSAEHMQEVLKESQEQPESSYGEWFSRTAFSGYAGKVVFRPEFEGDSMEAAAGYSVSPRFHAPLANGSIHRFDGRVRMGDYVFINRGGPTNRLTFGLLKGKGYVYLRGKGVVVLKEGKEVELGD
jgi:hypothetical protein